MASQHSHRKLLPSNSNSTTNPTVQTCLYFCNSQKNTTTSSSSPYSGFCPKVCLAICPSLCHYSTSTLPLPPDFPPSKPNNPQNLSPLLICMLILLATTFLLITFYILYTKLYFHFYAPHNNSFLQTRNDNNDSLDEGHRSRVVFHPFWYVPTVGLPSTAIKTIAVHVYKKGKMDERECAVCLTEFEEGDEFKFLPKCNHAFHLACIDTWLSSHVTCPLCRAPVIIHPDHHDDHDRGRGRDRVVEDVPSMLPSVEVVIEDNSHDEDVSTREGGGENLREINKGSYSQRWSLERGAANLLSRSLSCSGKIFSSRCNNIGPSPNS